MLNPFPDLLIFGLLAPTLLRLVLGGFFLYLSRQHVVRERRIEIASKLRAKWKVSGAWFVWALIATEVIVGVALIVGFLTQIAALLSAIFAVKLLVFRKRYPFIASEGVWFYVFMLAISLSLLLSGAGALAFDIPL